MSHTWTILFLWEYGGWNKVAAVAFCRKKTKCVLIQKCESLILARDGKLVFAWFFFNSSLSRLLKKKYSALCFNIVVCIIRLSFSSKYNCSRNLVFDCKTTLIACNFSIIFYKAKRVIYFQGCTQQQTTNILDDSYRSIYYSPKNVFICYLALLEKNNF